MLNYSIVDKIINNALNEDMPFGDCTTESIIPENTLGTVNLICKDNGILCGLDIFKRVFKLLGDVDISSNYKDGDEISYGNIIATLSGNVRNILVGERVALNILQRLSGIATNTKAYVEKLKDTNCKLLDTRKTTPGLRYLEKYATSIGGAVNHRYCLSDGILIKDNHISISGGVKNAVLLARKNSPFVRKIEVETESLQDVIEALESKADIIMLDNMSPENVKKMIDLIDNKAITECSGNITLNTIQSYAETGVQFISCGSIIYNAKLLDFSLKNLTLM